MDKTIKNYLKEAKEAVKEKDIKTALKLCKNVLKEDRNNYMALVILGAALQESENKNEAPNAFMKAIEVSRDQILAYQGLASYYEKHDSDNENLVSVYGQLLNLEKNMEKWKEILQKLNKLCMKLNKTWDIINITEPVLLEEDEEKFDAVILIFSRIFKETKEVPEEYLPVYEKFLEKMVAAPNHCINKSEFLKKYVKLLYSKKEYQNLFHQCEKMFASHKTDVYPLEWICKIYYELATSNELSKVDDFQSHIDKYIEETFVLNKNSAASYLAAGISSFYKTEYAAARDFLNSAVEIKSQIWQAWYWLTKTYFILQCYTDVLYTVTQTKINFPTDGFIKYEKILDKIYMQTLSRLQKTDKCEICVNLCSKILQSEENNENALECLIRSSIYLNDIESAKRLLDRLKKLRNHDDGDMVLLESAIEINQGSWEKAVEMLQNFVANFTEVPEIYLVLGEIYMDHEKHKEAFDSFLRAAKIAPYMYKVFQRLGDYYSNIAGNPNNAIKCYKRAFHLNPQSDELGIILSDLYRNHNLSESNFELLDVVTKMGGKKWAWLRLGLQYLNSGNIQEAIEALRRAVRLDPENSHYLESLADAYMLKGSYMAALKCYEKCHELKPDSIYCLFQLATIKTFIGLYDESIAEFRELISQNPDYVPALKGFSNTCLLKARESAAIQDTASSIEFLQQAASSVVRALKISNGLSYLWKLLGDICLSVTKLPTSIAYLKVCSQLFPDRNSVNDEVTLNKEQVLQLALKCFYCVLKINQVDTKLVGHAWYNIALCYNYMAMNSAPGPDKVGYRCNAFSSAKKCVSCLPTFWQHWNILGFISASKEINNPKLAQHCYIRAVLIERNNALPWYNLGILYFNHGNIQLAHEAFSVGQNVEPEFFLPWMGQAFIAKSVDHEDAADLFYHSLQLEYTVESAICFAECILKILKNWTENKSNQFYYYFIENLGTTELAALYLERYIEFYPDDLCATNMLAVLNEWNGHYSKSLRNLESIVDKVSSDDHRDIIFRNLGRVLFKLNRYDDSINYYKKIKTVDFASQCGLAISQFKGGLYEDSYQTYETIITWYTSDDLYISHITVAMAMIVYVSKSDTDVFFQCLQMKPVSVYGLFSACALAILSGNWNLLNLALKELRSYEDDEEYVYHIAVFNSYFHFLQDSYEQSVKCLTDFTNKAPGNASLHYALAVLLLHNVFKEEKSYDEKAGIAAMSVKRSIEIANTTRKNTSHIYYTTLGLCYLLSGDKNECLRSCRMVVRLFPHVAESWALFIAAHYLVGFESSYIQKFISFVRKRMDCSRSLSIWLGNMERRISINE